ncbi:MAG: beta family protein [Alphaproteobacteria bacterium]|nr:beta family protein [Alphaproteobacteria bacterium]MBF0354985.1 beta family protein [Alphaproteobacteria bacterium]
MTQKINFDAYSYYPSLRTRSAEMRGYKELLDADKNALLPILVLSLAGKAKTIAEMAANTSGLMGERLFIADHTKDKGHYGEDSKALLHPGNDFEAWRRLAREAMPNAVPVALITEAAKPRDVARQSVKIEQACGRVALRIRDVARDVPKAVAAINAVDDVNNVLTIVDVGYIRGNEGAKLRETVEAINAIRDAAAEARIVTMSTSYPRSVAAYGDDGGSLEILERRLFAGLGGADVAIYGDHASIHIEPYETKARGWVPRIDYALSDAWFYRRYRNDDGGYKKCAKEIMGSPDWDPELLKQGVWGAKMIAEAAKGKLEGLGSPAVWIAARVNLHLHQQVEANNTMFAGLRGDEDDEVDVFE